MVAMHPSLGEHPLDIWCNASIFGTLVAGGSSRAHGVSFNTSPSINSRGRWFLMEDIGGVGASPGLSKPLLYCQKIGLSCTLYIYIYTPLREKDVGVPGASPDHVNRPLHPTVLFVPLPRHLICKSGPEPHRAVRDVWRKPSDSAVRTRELGGVGPLVC